MTGKPTPGEWRYVAGTCGVYRTSDDVTIVDYGGLQFPDNDGPMIAAAGTSAHQLYEAGYDGLEAVKALPELLETLKRMDRMHELMMRDVNHKQSAYQAETLREMNEAPLQTQRLLSRLAKKEAPDDAA